MKTMRKGLRLLIALLPASLAALWAAGCSIEEAVDPYPAVSVSETYSGTGLTGRVKRTMVIDEGVELTVVVK